MPSVSPASLGKTRQDRGWVLKALAFTVGTHVTPEVPSAGPALGEGNRASAESIQNIVIVLSDQNGHGA